MGGHRTADADVVDGGIFGEIRFIIRPHFHIRMPEQQRFRAARLRARANFGSRIQRARAARFYPYPRARQRLGVRIGSVTDPLGVRKVEIAGDLSLLPHDGQAVTARRRIARGQNAALQHGFRAAAHLGKHRVPRGAQIKAIIAVRLIVRAENHAVIRGRRRHHRDRKRPVFQTRRIVQSESRLLRFRHIAGRPHEAARNRPILDCDLGGIRLLGFTQNVGKLHPRRAGTHPVALAPKGIRVGVGEIQFAVHIAVDRRVVPRHFQTVGSRRIVIRQRFYPADRPAV